MKTDVDGFPTVCCVCGEKIVKSRHDSQHHYDHKTKTASSWHTTCSPKIYCGADRHGAEYDRGRWFCGGCGEEVKVAL